MELLNFSHSHVQLIRFLTCMPFSIPSLNVPASQIDIHVPRRVFSLKYAFIWKINSKAIKKSEVNITPIIFHSLHSLFYLLREKKQTPKPKTLTVTIVISVHVWFIGTVLQFWRSLNKTIILTNNSWINLKGRWCRPAFSWNNYLNYIFCLRKSTMANFLMLFAAYSDIFNFF